MHIPYRLALALTALLAAFTAGCATEELEEGRGVVASRNAPAANCRFLGNFSGRGGGSFGGGFVSNDDLMEYALNDLRNEVGRAGGNYVQHDPIVLAQESRNTTTTASVTGSGYACP